MVTALQEKEIGKRLRPLYLAAFFQGFVLWYAIEKLFMQSIGFNYQTIAVATAVYIVVMLLANIPFGILADRWSRKGVLYVSIVMLVASSLVCGLSHSFWPYVIGASLWGLFFASYTGTYDSVIYDTVQEVTGKGDGFEKYYGRVQASDGIALVTSSLLSGVVAHYISLRADFLLSIPCVAGAAVALFFLHEPKLHKQGATLTIRKHFGEIATSLTRNKIIAVIVLSLICISVVQRVLFEFPQVWYIAMGLPVILYGVGMALILAGYGSGGLIASKLQRGRVVIFLAALLTLVASVGLVFRSTVVVVIVAQVAVITGVVALGIIVDRYLHDELASNIRAGGSSVVGTLGYAASVPVILGFGTLSRDYSVFTAGWLITASLVAVVIVLGMVLLYRRKSSDAGTLDSAPGLPDTNIR